MGGELKVVTGPVRSGKTRELVRELRSAESFKAFKPVIDASYGEEHVIAGGGEELPATPVEVRSGVETVFDLVSGKNPGLVGIDEAQFFENSLVNEVVRLRQEGFDVVVAGLDRDFRGEPFEPVPTLMDMADETEELKAECAVCGGTASRTQRLVDGNPAPYDGPQVEFRDSVEYEPRCVDCHEVPGRPGSTGAG